MSKVCWLDVETTGLSAENNDIVQIGVLIEIDGVVKERLEVKCQPLDWSRISSRALEVHGFTLDDLRLFPEPVELRYKLSELFGKYQTTSDPAGFVMAGYNIAFDWRFVRAYFDKQGDPETFLSMFTGEQLDVMKYFKEYSKERKSITNNRLVTAAAHFGYKFNAHDALEDIEVTRKIYLQLVDHKEKEGGE